MILLWLRAYNYLVTEMDNIEQSLLNSIEHESLNDLAIEYTELSLDAFLEDGILKDIPFFGSLYKGIKGVLGIKDALFAQKVFKFLTQIASISFDERRRFIAKIESDSNEKIKVGQTLLLILDKLDDFDKPKIIGNLFSATIKSQITYDEFLRLSLIVQRAYYSDLIKLNNSVNYSETTRDHFSSIGLLVPKIKKVYGGYNKFIVGSDTPELVIEYELSSLSRKLYKYGLKASASD